MNPVPLTEKASKREQLKRIRSELVHGRDLARRLRTHASSSSQESSLLFVDGLVNSYNRSIFMLTLPVQPPQPGSRTARDNPVIEEDGKNKYGKRKCIKQATLAKGAGLETGLEDGYIWRKYGQKDILGSKYPRGYYRCTHKATQGCLAKKQVQRTEDQGPPVFNITYRGVHSCSHLPSNSLLSPPSHESCVPTPFPEHANDLILSPDTTTHINFHMNIMSPLDVGMTCTSWFAANCGVDCYQIGGCLECDVHSAITGHPTVGLKFDPLSEFADWDADT